MRVARRQAPGSGDFVPYVGIERHAVVGDRRTAALVASDGNVDWLCAPGYSGAPLFGALVDAARGGHFRFGPTARWLGAQRYDGDTAVLCTRWQTARFALELTDAMLWPEDERPDARQRAHVLVRRLRCLGGEVDVALTLHPRVDFQREVEIDGEGRFAVDGLGECRLWSSRRLGRRDDGVMVARDRLRGGEEWWAVLALACDEEWDERRAAEALEETAATWRRWVARLDYEGPRAARVRRAAVTVHLLTYAPDGAVVAAPTTSLPERTGGDWNADYRLAWVRDASLSVTSLARLGDTSAAGRLLDWMAALPSHTSAPLDVAYPPNGRWKPKEHERKRLHGYRGSRPVRFGNHAWKQHQLDALGFLVECAFVFVDKGGRLDDAQWSLVARSADWTAKHWREKGNGIWELPVEQQYTSGRVMSWVALDRAARLAGWLGHADEAARWHAAAHTVRNDVLTRGWCEALGAFRQRYEAATLDAAALLVPLSGLLPASDPRVRSTVAAIEERLTIDGFVYRFRPLETPGLGDEPLGEFEGAFLPCTFWLAAAQAMIGDVDKAQETLTRAETIAGPLGLFAEAVDPRSGSFAGNTPLLFSHVEYVRAVLELARAIDARRAPDAERRAGAEP